MPLFSIRHIFTATDTSAEPIQVTDRVRGKKRQNVF
jgi:hypothetical protein